jgi:hypothetical protein
MLNMKVDNEWFQGEYAESQKKHVEEAQVDKATRKESEVAFGKIGHISVFGEVDIELNLTDRHVAKELDLQTIDNKVLEVYIEPANNWNQFRE